MMKFAKKKDIIIIILILLFSLALYLVYDVYNKKNSTKEAKAEIYYESELIATIPLNEKVDKTFSLPQNEHVVFHLYEDGSIRFEESDCPDKVCINTGKLKHIGSTAACLPNKLILKVVSANNTDDNDVDMIIGN